MKELPRLHPLAKSHVQKTLDVTADPAEKGLKTIGETLNLSGLGRQSENNGLANQKLIANLILRERNVRWPHAIVEDVKCLWAAPSSTKRMPLRGQTSASNMDRSLVKDKSIRVAKNAHQIGGKFTEDLDILDAVAFPSDAGNVHRVLWRTFMSPSKPMPYWGS